ncbi:hypothetical protein MXB_730, partial [Myxobolus squamalis]
MNESEFEQEKNIDLNIEAAKQLELMAENERKRKNRITSGLFAETDSERHERLKNLVYILHEKCDEEKNISKSVPKAEVLYSTNDKTHSTDLWYHEGPAELISARLWIGYYSLCRVQDRLSNERMLSKRPEFEKAAKFQEVQKRFNAFEYRSSQLGDDRPLTYCQVSPDGKSIMTAS